MLLHPKNIDITLQKQCDCDKQTYKITLIASKKVIKTKDIRYLKRLNRI